jgi:hypothetical protein
MSNVRDILNAVGNLPTEDLPTLANVLAVGAAANSVAITGLAAMTGAGEWVNTKSVATPWAQTRLVRAELTLTGAITGKTTLAYSGVRGLITLASGASADSGFFYGTQGKLVVDGATVAIGSNKAAGIYAQMSATGATVTSGYVAALVADVQTPPSTGGAYVNCIYAEQVTGTAINAVLKANVNSTYFLDLGGAGTKTWAVAAGTGANSAALAGGGVAAKVLAVKVDDTAYFIPLFSSNAN